MATPVLTVQVVQLLTPPVEYVPELQIVQLLLEKPYPALQEAGFPVVGLQVATPIPIVQTVQLLVPPAE